MKNNSIGLVGAKLRQLFCQAMKTKGCIKKIEKLKNAIR